MVQAPLRERKAARFTAWQRVAGSLWRAWEWLFGVIYRLYTVPGDRHGVVRFGFRRWDGEASHLRDGTIVEPGDWVAEVHLNSPRVMEKWVETGGSPAVLVTTLSKELKDTFSALVREWEEGRLPVPVKALYGKTLLHRAVGRVGFEVHDLPDTYSHRWLARYERWLAAMYHPARAGRGGEAGRVEPLKIAWMSAGELRRRYG